jgi:hypothetical protein
MLYTFESPPSTLGFDEKDLGESMVIFKSLWQIPWSKEMDLGHCHLAPALGTPDECAMPVLGAIEGLLSSREEQPHFSSNLVQPRRDVVG